MTPDENTIEEMGVEIDDLNKKIEEHEIKISEYEKINENNKKSILAEMPLNAMNNEKHIEILKREIIENKYALSKSLTVINEMGNTISELKLENKIWNEIIKFNVEFFPKWEKTELIYWSNALAGEVGELCNIVKKLYGGGTKIISLTDTDLMDKVFNEIADITIYLYLMINGSLGLSYKDYETIVLNKIKVNRERMLNKTKTLSEDNLHYEIGKEVKDG